MNKVACLLLVAGKSSRMGVENKLLLELDGQTVLARVAHELVQAPFIDFVAVTGHDFAHVEQALSVFDFRIVRNPDFAVGMHSSIRRGLLALPPVGVDYFAVCLGDQPFLTSADYSALISATDTGADLIYPVIDSERGQPVLISMKLREEILAHEDDDRGCQYLFKKYGGLAVDLTHSANALAFYDVDTPEAFAHARHMMVGGTV